MLQINFSLHSSLSLLPSILKENDYEVTVFNFFYDSILSLYNGFVNKWY